jgi:hypothetical protein
MARDRLGSTPQGALARHPADFFADELYTGGYSPVALFTPGLGGFVAVSLFNQDAQGRVAKVYGITSVNYAGGGQAAGWVNGSFGTFVGPCQGIRPDRGSIPVFIYQNTIIGPGAVPPYPTSFPPIASIIGNSGFDSFTLLSPFPLFIVPVGWSLVLSNIVADDFGGQAFWFEMAAA